MEDTRLYPPPIWHLTKLSFLFILLAIFPSLINGVRRKSGPEEELIHTLTEQIHDTQKRFTPSQISDSLDSSISELCNLHAAMLRASETIHSIIKMKGSSLDSCKAQSPMRDILLEAKKEASRRRSHRSRRNWDNDNQY